MSMSVASLTFLIGLALIVIGIFGGGIEVKEVKIPTLPAVSRALSFLVGAALVGICEISPQVLPGASANLGPAQTQTVPPASQVPTVPHGIGDDRSKIFLGAAIQNHLTTVHEVKAVLRHLNKYSGSMDEYPSDEYFQAVGDFQVSQSVDADGLVGPTTYAKLREAWPEHFASR
jgi:hypothetical protein